VERYAGILEQATALLEGLEAQAMAAAQAGDEAALHQALAAIREVRRLIESIGQDLATARRKLWAHKALAGGRFRKGGVVFWLRKTRWLYPLASLAILLAALLLYRPLPRPVPKPTFEPLRPPTQDLTQALVIAPAAPPLVA
jgi:hypothetical protein